MPATPTVADVVTTIHAMYDPSGAESWDAVGLATGDPEAPVHRVLFAVDPVQAVVEEAVAWKADLLVVHHPLLLKPVHSVAATTPKGRAVHRLVRGGVALLFAHTNADAPVTGVSDAMAQALGLIDVRPIAPASAPALDKLVVFVPQDDADRVGDALADAGAGEIGDYDRCRFTSSGIGSFRPRPGASPAIGAVGRLEQVAETRIEMVLPRGRRSAVLSALTASHPYEQPAFDLLEIAELPGDAGHGRVGRLAEPTTLGAFCAAVVSALPATHSVARVAGDNSRHIETVAVCGGAGDFLLDAVRRCGADVFVTSDLRHHPASELTEHTAAPALIDVPHWAAESLWLPIVATRLLAALGARGTTVETRVSRLVTDPWTGHTPMTRDTMIPPGK